MTTYKNVLALGYYIVMGVQQEYKLTQKFLVQCLNDMRPTYIFKNICHVLRLCNEILNNGNIKLPSASLVTHYCEKWGGVGYGGTTKDYTIFCL